MPTCRTVLIKNGSILLKEKKSVRKGGGAEARLGVMGDPVNGKLPGLGDDTGAVNEHGGKSSWMRPSHVRQQNCSAHSFGLVAQTCLQGPHLAPQYA